MKNIPIKTVVAIGIGAALFVVIGLVINIPTPAPNTSIQLQYAVQALLSLVFGPVAGFLVGFIGHFVKDAVTYGAWWSWIIASGVFGLIIGLAKSRFRIEDGIFTGKDIVLFNVIQILANIVCWGVVAPVLDIIIYNEPIEKLFVQGLVAGIANAVSVGVAGTLLILVYAKTKMQQNSLSKED